MNILFTSDLSGMGGGETSLVNLCLELKHDHNVFVLCAVEGKLVNVLNQNGISTFVFNYRDKKRLINSLVKIRKIVNHEHIEIIHSNDPLTSIIMHYAVCGLKTKTYWTCHGQWYSFQGIKKKLIINSNKHVFCVSSKVQESLIKMGFQNTSVTYLGIPISKYQDAKSTNLRYQYSIPKDDMLIACIGRFQPIKGQLKLAKAVKTLIEEDFKVTCLFIGGCIYGNNEDQAYHDEIVSYIDENGLKEKVILLGERDDIPGILKEIDCLVIPSDNESFGMVAIESLAAGTPVLSTPNDGVSEILRYSKKYISETNDEYGIKKLLELFAHEDVDEQVDFAKKRRNDFSIDVIAKKYIKIFEER